jgi:hypothetical protein
MASSRWHARDPHLHIVGYRGLAVMTPIGSTGRTSECPRRALAPLHVKVGKPNECAVCRIHCLLAEVTDAANGRRGIMPDVRRREFILFPTEPRPLGRARQSPRGYRRVAAVTNLWRLTAALTATILLGSLLPSGAEARILVCWWEYPGRMCTIVKSAKSTIRPYWAGNGYRSAPPRCPRGFWAVCGECPC